MSKRFKTFLYSLFKFRFIPIAVIGLCLFASVKIVELFDPTLQTVTSLFYETKPVVTKPIKKAELKQPVTKNIPPEIKNDLIKNTAETKPDGSGKTNTGKQSPDDSMGSQIPEEDYFDPLDLSNSEIDLLQDLRKRRIEIRKSEKALELRKKELAIVENQVNEKIKDLRRLEKRVKELLGQYDKNQARKQRSLVKIYENMKPDEAAKILEKLNLVILLDVVEKMSQRKVAPILARMDPMKAKIITEQLAQRFSRSSSDLLNK